MDVRGIGWEGVNWLRVGTIGGGAVVNTVMNLQVT
jgi:hypothetical protein